ncbi:threonine synthase n terminus [Lucifera butyrica]|uniref:Threonine synthase n=1 Tax=Lucifera butyrica TaxID=1351585 RepID=A0A498R7E4_9FIRM|nr:threonine synthase [Lucifera butyrica]VBB08676.1 threonine synthase n terminus [Lucifera butyrica]
MYISTRGGKDSFSASMVIKKGISVDGGLFVPNRVPSFGSNFVAQLVPMDYCRRAVAVLQPFLDDYSPEEIHDCVRQAYGKAKFDCAAVAPLVPVGADYMLELWHGPTCAFKDMALQMLPHLLTHALRKNGETRETVILVATSGDTGKAALEGFRDVDRTRIIVFYPDAGVSEMQRLQMVSQEGNNVAVIAVQGNFDDTQTGVKNIFNDPLFNRQLQQDGFELSSANSINWGRLMPQIVYYFSAYADMVRDGRLVNGQAVNFVVPTGNFGNILAGYYARLMGLPVQRLICASNSNNVLTDFLRTGIYDRQRPFHKTISPSMDILISSNVERFLYHMTRGNTEQVRHWMEDLKTGGSYRVDETTLRQIQEVFWADWVSDRSALQSIQEVYGRYGYVMDPHTAVAWKVCETYRQQTGDKTPAVIVSTASPFKFNASVLQAVNGEQSVQGFSEFAMLEQLSQLTGWPVPAGLAILKNKKILHRTICEKQEMPHIVQQVLKS